MKISKLKRTDSVNVTVHFNDISLTESSRFGKEFRNISKNMGLYIAQPTHLDDLKYTDLYFRIPDPTGDWKKIFMSALAQAVESKGWFLDDTTNEPTTITEPT